MKVYALYMYIYVCVYIYVFDLLFSTYFKLLTCTCLCFNLTCNFEILFSIEGKDREIFSNRARNIAILKRHDRSFFLNKYHSLSHQMNFSSNLFSAFISRINFSFPFFNRKGIIFFRKLLTVQLKVKIK